MFGKLLMYGIYIVYPTVGNPPGHPGFCPDILKTLPHNYIKNEEQHII